LVVENQNAIQCAVEDGFVFALGSIKRVSRLSVFATSQKQKSNMQDNGYAKSDENKGEQNGRQRRTIETRSEGSREQGDGREANENRAGAHPALRLGPRYPCARSLHRVTGVEEASLPGPSELPT